MTIVYVALAILFLAASGFYSGSEMGLYCANPVRTRLRAERGGLRARMLLRLTNRQSETVFAILLGTNLANYLLTVAISLLLIDAFSVQHDRVDVYTALILSPLIFVLGDVVPKNWYRIDADRLMHRSALALRTSVAAFRWTGLLALLRGMTRLGARLAGHDGREDLGGPRGEVLGLLREGAAGGALTPDQTRIVEGVMSLSTVRVGAIMIPRRHVVSVPVEISRADFEILLQAHDHSRLVVIDRDGRSVAGIVNVYDVLADDDGGSVADWLTPAVTVPARETAAGTLVHLQRNRAAMALVIDPRRGFVGIVTLKDVVDEIFGELPAW